MRPRFFFYLISIFPAGWLFGHITQVVWIFQECGTPELLSTRERICADNALRLQWGGVLGIGLFFLIFTFLQWPFRSQGAAIYDRVLRRICAAFQAFTLCAFAFFPGFRNERYLTAVGVLFLITLIWLLRIEITALFAIPPGSLPRTKDRFLNVLFYGAVCYQLVFAVLGINKPILDHFSWRQTQTSITTYFLVKEGFRIDYITPIFGKPWAIPMEFPLYQYTVALLVKLTGLSIEVASRIVSLLAFYGSLAMVRFTLKNLGFSPMILRLSFIFLLLCPLHLFYARTALIETLATFLGVAAIWAATEFFRGKKWYWLILLCFLSSLCAVTKITTFVVFCFFLAGVFIFYLEKPFLRNFSGRPLLRQMAGGIAGGLVPLFIGILWVRHADSVKSLNPVIGDMWTSVALTEWNFGTIQQRLSVDFWQRILFSRLSDVFGFLSPLVLFMFLLSLIKWRKLDTFWPFVLMGAFFAGPLIFSNLYYVHDYYFVANSLFLLIALGIWLGSAYERAQGAVLRHFRLLIFLPIVLSCVGWHWDKFVPKQMEKKDRFITIGKRVQDLTQDTDIVVMHGEIAHADLPFYTKRKVLIHEPDKLDFDSAKMQRALKNLEDENIAAVLIPTDVDPGIRKHLIEKYAARYKFRTIPATTVEGVEIYLK